MTQSEDDAPKKSRDQLVWKKLKPKIAESKGVADGGNGGAR